jgi:hypothetical protein
VITSRFSDLSPLLKEEAISYYWLGFLIADAHFDGNRVILGLSEKAKPHLERFADFINYKGKIKHYVGAPRLAVMHTSVVKTLRSRYKISNNKTMSPCDISHIMDDTMFICFVAGFIDGDGCIAKQTGRNDCQITIKLHNSWLNNLQFISNRICCLASTTPSIARINKCGYAEVYFSNSILLKFIKRKCVENALPVLSRKWDKIDLNLIGRVELSKSHITSVSKMMPFYKNIEIQRKLGLSSAAITLIIQRNNLKRKAMKGDLLIGGELA